MSVKAAKATKRLKALVEERVRPTPVATLDTVKDALRQMRVQVLTVIGNGEYLLAMLDQLTADIRLIERKPGPEPEYNLSLRGTL